MNLDRSINALLAKRESVLNQVVAIDRALAILRSTEATATVAKEREKGAQAAPERANVASLGTAGTVTRVQPKRVLSEEHKAALVKGRRKAGLAREVAAGRAFEPIEVPGLARSISSEAPRLVKKTGASSASNGRPELTVEPDMEAERTAEIAFA